MNAAELVAALDAIDNSDLETAHKEADSVLLDSLPPEVGEAYERLVDRCRWWAHA